MSLAEFKTIFWWEWTHRLLGRLIGAAFLLPFLWFLWRHWIPGELRPRLQVVMPQVDEALTRHLAELDRVKEPRQATAQR